MTIVNTLLTQGKDLKISLEMLVLQIGNTNALAL